MASYIARCKGCQTVMQTNAYRLDRASADMGALVYDATGQSGVIGALTMPCRSCGRLRQAKAVVGKLSPKHVCNAKCESSIGLACECSCGGKNHGRAFAA